MQLVKAVMQFRPYFSSLKEIGKECAPYDQAHMELFSLKKEHWSLTIGHELCASAIQSVLSQR